MPITHTTETHQSVIRVAYPNEVSLIEKQLQKFNAAHIAAFGAEQVSVGFIALGQTLGQTRIVGGIIGQIAVGWLYIETLWVEEQRRRTGIGQALVNAIEADARRRECRGSLVDTFNWQAEPFYLGQGYQVFARLDDCPLPGSTRIYMRKILPPLGKRGQPETPPPKQLPEG